MRLAWLVAGAMIVTSVLAGSGCSTEPSSSRRAESTRTTSQAIQNGTTDATHTFAVGLVMGVHPDGRYDGFCSGALILPNVVATARHCVDDSPHEVDCTKNPSFGSRREGPFRVTTNTTLDTRATSGWYDVASDGIFVPEDDHICGHDIALVVLSESIPDDVAKPITPGVQYPMWDPAHYEPYFKGIGYGNTAPNVGGGTRRISINSIDVLCVPGSEMMPCPPEVHANEFVGGDGTCSGDSGSSAYEFQSLKTTPVSFGVLSRGGESEDGTRCIGSIYTRFDAYRDFVLQVAKTASANWTLYPEPSWTEYKPPPAPSSKDAGADSAPTTEPSGRGLGEECESADECSSGVCSDSGDGTQICTKACDESAESACPDGYECRESLCLPPLPAPSTPAASTTTTTTTGCAAGASATASGSWAWTALGAVVALAAVRRRKR